ncbi:MAG: cell division ATP-binding protein FtsE [Pseudobdellovibrionaceae bacterium]
MIEMQHLYKTYPGPTHALKNIHLKIDKSEFVFLTGASGAGKTTLFKMISAFDRPSSGRIIVAGFELNHLTVKETPYFRRRIGVVFQDFKLLKNKTIFENVALPLQIRNEKELSIKKKVYDMLEQVGLIYKKNQYPEFLSGGEQQRTAIARALIHQPGVLIADEPTGNLDPQLSEEIMDLFEKVSLQGTTVFIATHDHALVSRRKKRVLNLKHGVLTDSIDHGAEVDNFKESTILDFTA